MAQRVQPVRGMHDILPDDGLRHRHVIETARTIAGLYGYRQIETPIVEQTTVFQRTLGDTSDIVTKEMYTFVDRGGEQITLRPEATAGIARAFISGGMAHALPLKVFTAGPMFRFERPQKGRLRQFHQIDIELLGVAEPAGDVEVIAAAAHVLEALGVLDRTTLELNTLGDTESRNAYRSVLVDYLKQHVGRLSEDSRERLERNPLRILDSKDPGDREIVAAAPIFTNYLTDNARAYFAATCGGLEALGIAYSVNPRLVRGLDYYGHTAFEFTTTALGSQGAVIAGGRYDGLIELMGGPPTPGIGWAGGIERLAMLCAAPPAAPRVAMVMPVTRTELPEAMRLAQDLRKAGIPVDMAYTGNLKKWMKHANKNAARAAVILGEAEVAQGTAKLRDLDSGEERDVLQAGLPEACRLLGIGA
jgi:histidyl-tRNA synthetase